jgi:hypothetical protein
LVEKGGSVLQSVEQLRGERKGGQEAAKRRLGLGKVNLNLLLLARSPRGVKGAVVKVISVVDEAFKT